MNGLKKAKVFIGSSSEGHEVAEYLQAALERHCQPTIWSQGVFGLSEGNLDALIKATRRHDFAILVLSPDDFIKKRDSEAFVPRDNVIFEIGLFIGSLGRNRTFMVHRSDHKIEMPSDLAGVTVATYLPRDDGQTRAAVNPVALRIREAMREFLLEKGTPDVTEVCYNFILKVINTNCQSVEEADITRFYIHDLLSDTQYKRLGESLLDQRQKLK